MAWRLLVTPVLTLALATALLISLAFHFDGSAHLDVSSFARSGPDARPTLRIDFDANLDRELELAELVRLEPPAPIEVRRAGARRLLIRPRSDLPAGTRYRVVLDDSLAAADGRPVAPDLLLEFDSGAFGLAEPPIAARDDAGRPIVRLRFSGPVAADDLRTHLRIESDGALPYRLTGSGDEWTATLDYGAEEEATLWLLAGLAGGQAAVALEEEVRHEVRWDRTLDFVRARASFRRGRGTVRLRFSGSLDDALLDGFVEVHPRIDDLEIGGDGRDLVVRGSFVAGQEVSVRVRRGLATATGDTLRREIHERLRIPGADPELRFLQSGRALSTEARPELEIGGVNVPRVEVELRRVYPNNLVRLALRESLPALSTPPIRQTIAIDSPVNVEWSRTLDLAELSGEPLRGVYEARIRCPEDNWTRDRSIVQASDLAPIVRVRDQALVAMVARLSDGEPVAGATVAVYSRTNQVAATGLTDGDGIFRARQLPFEPFLVAATLGEELAFVDLRTHRATHRAEEIEGRPAAAGLEAFLYTDRGLVRPGEKARLRGLLRDASGRAPARGLPVRLALFGPDDREVKTVRRRTSEFGWVEQDFAFPLDARTGSYRVEAHLPGSDRSVGRVRFRIEAFVPDRIEPSLELPHEILRAGASVPLDLSARLLDGRLAAGHAARVEVRYSPEPETIDGFRFGDAERLPEPFTVPLSEIVLDNVGRARVECRLPHANRAGVALRALFRLEVLDEGGRAAFAAAERRVVPNGPRLGLGAPHGPDLVVPVMLHDGESAEAQAVLERERWKGNWVREDGRSVWRSRRVLERLQSIPVRVSDGRGLVRFADPGRGEFRVSIDAPGCVHAAIRVRNRGEGFRFHTDSGPVAPRLLMRRTSSRAIPGLPSEIEVDAPFAGRALLTLEGAGVFEAWPIALDAGRQSIFVEVPDCDAVNLHATLTLVRGVRDAGEAPTRQLAALALPLDLPERRLSITANATGEVQPGEQLEIDLETSRPAEVMLHLVDVGVLRRSSHPVPDPAAHFGALRRLDTRLADVYSRLLDRMRFGGEDAEPGGGASLKERLDPNQAQLIETVAIASRLVRVDGRATVPLEVPETYEGRLRLVAVAAGETGTGSDAREVVVRAPISLRMFTPRVAAPGDTFTVPLVVRGEYTRRKLELDGPIELVGPEGERTLELRATDELGVATVRLVLGDDRGNETRRTAKISIRPAAAYTVKHVVSAVDGSLEGSLPEGFLETHRRATVTVGTINGLDLLPNLERLLEYPHGCLEQTTSRAFPILAWHELLRQMHPEGDSLSSRVEASIDRLLTMQTSSGGLAVWPGGDDSYPFGSVYAADFLLEAREAGYAVPAGPLDDLLQSLERSLQRGEAGAYATLVLTRAGRPMRAWLDRMSETETSVESRARLAAAYLRLGDRARARELLGDAADPWAAPRMQGGELTSPVRAAAVLLDALVATDPGDARIPELVLRLQGAAKKTADRTTQENAAALLALARYYRAPAQQQGDVSGHLTLGFRSERIDDATGVSLSTRPGEDWRFACRANAPLTIVIRAEGIPTGPEAGVVERGMSLRRWFEDLAGERVEGAFEQGRVYRVVIEGIVPDGSENLLIADLLAGGLEIEDARDQPGNVDPDRVEPRDDRVLFFRTAPIEGTFRQTYLVRAVTAGRFALPGTEAELMYEPTIRARAEAGTIEVRRR